MVRPSNHAGETMATIQAKLTTADNVMALGLVLVVSEVVPLAYNATEVTKGEQLVLIFQYDSNAFHK